METAEPPPEQVIAWLRSGDDDGGQVWSSGRNSTLGRHREDSGVFADVTDDPADWDRRASWPRPLSYLDLDNA